MTQAKAKRLIRVTVSLDPDEYAEFGKLAKKTDVSISWLIRRAMSEFLKRYGTSGQPELPLHLTANREVKQK